MSQGWSKVKLGFEQLISDFKGLPALKQRAERSQWREKRESWQLCGWVAKTGPERSRVNSGVGWSPDGIQVVRAGQKERKGGYKILDRRKPAGVTAWRWEVCSAWFKGVFHFFPHWLGCNVPLFRLYFFLKNLILTSLINSCQTMNIRGIQEEFIHLITGSGFILNSKLKLTHYRINNDDGQDGSSLLKARIPDTAH